MNTPSNTSNIPVQPNQDENMDSWFSELIDDIKVDHLLMQTKTASKEKSELYDALIKGDDIKVLSRMRGISSQYFIKRLLFDYMKELKDCGKLPIKLALGISDSKILVWSEINDDDEEMENTLLIAEAKVNSKYQPKGFYINSTIIERSDNIPVPAHYQLIIN